MFTPSSSRLIALFLLFFLATSHGHSTKLSQRQTTSKYCPPSSSICFLEVITRPSNPVFRLAIPDATTAPFDALLQITAPVALGWAGFSWGGGMTGNPLTVAWPNGNNATVSSRWATYVLYSPPISPLNTPLSTPFSNTQP